MNHIELNSGGLSSCAPRICDKDCDLATEPHYTANFFGSCVFKLPLSPREWGPRWLRERPKSSFSRAAGKNRRRLGRKGEGVKRSREQLYEKEVADFLHYKLINLSAVLYRVCKGTPATLSIAAENLGLRIGAARVVELSHSALVKGLEM